MSEKECRICFDTDDQDDIISPCNCKGTSKWIHKECLYESLKHNKRPCICGFLYKFNESVTINKKKYFFDFIGNMLPFLVGVAFGLPVVSVIRPTLKLYEYKYSNYVAIPLVGCIVGLNVVNSMVLSYNSSKIVNIGKPILKN